MQNQIIYSVYIVPRSIPIATFNTYEETAEMIKKLTIEGKIVEVRKRIPEADIWWTIKPKQEFKETIEGANVKWVGWEKGYLRFLKARKTYKCHICGKEIKPNEIYARWIVLLRLSVPLCYDCAYGKDLEKLLKT
jgi:hypothetical protein